MGWRGLLERRVFSLSGLARSNYFVVHAAVGNLIDWYNVQVRQIPPFPTRVI
jgi:hypothetical protein